MCYWLTLVKLPHDSGSVDHAPDKPEPDLEGVHIVTN